jgi:hypothetical protein
MIPIPEPISFLVFQIPIPLPRALCESMGSWVQSFHTMFAFGAGIYFAVTGLLYLSWGLYKYTRNRGSLSADDLVSESALNMAVALLCASLGLYLGVTAVILFLGQIFSTIGKAVYHSLR